MESYTGGKEVGKTGEENEKPVLPRKKEYKIYNNPEARKVEKNQFVTC